MLDVSTDLMPRDLKKPADNQRPTSGAHQGGDGEDKRADCCADSSLLCHLLLGVSFAALEGRRHSSASCLEWFARHSAKRTATTSVTTTRALLPWPRAVSRWVGLGHPVAGPLNTERLRVSGQGLDAITGLYGCSFKFMAVELPISRSWKNLFCQGPWVSPDSVARNPQHLLDWTLKPKPPPALNAWACTQNKGFPEQSNYYEESREHAIQPSHCRLRTLATRAILPWY